MKKMKKAITFIIAMAICVASLSMFASAAFSHWRRVYDPERFEDNEWEHTRHYVCDGKYIGRLVYGYDTDYIDEDYAWAYGADCSATAAIKRTGYDSEYQSGQIATKNNYSKIQISNKSNDVYYRITLHADYSGVTSYLDEDTNENV